ncbi:MULTISPECIES: hypothetical protein [Bacillaceae]|uniref:Uncharacterized protein n=1 Tax=Evansella alkalicola TaxID=745819 RepID=A0ABS6JWA1_9BACI|nr:MULTISPECIES: hypothetical protein [Bacillaceae]MBU9722873.1 hypothetical protein [Bacillus alkalicola]
MKQAVTVTKTLFILVTLIGLLPLLGLSKSEKVDLVLTEVHTTIIEAEHILRYDITITNQGDSRLESEFDYPGHHPLGFQITVRPNEALEKLMVMEENTTYKKMRSMGGGASGIFEPHQDAKFNIEYQINEEADFQEVEKNAYDAVLLLIDGVEVIQEFPLN